MAFEFGILAEIDVEVSTLALSVTILFLICFDVLTRLTEYFFRNELVYNKMLQKMYKELMTMGFVTLFSTLYTAANESSVFARYSTEIDFVGYVTFFVAIFFVAHALYIMLLSMRTRSRYEYLHRLKIGRILELFTKSQDNFWQRFFYGIPYFPLSSVRHKMEFKIIHSLFRDTYWLPTNFDYGSYLSRSFEKYSLKMINIGWSSWMIMIILGLMNFFRVKFFSSTAYFSCSKFINEGNSTQRRMLMDESRFLVEASHDCLEMNVMMFLISGSVIVIYAFSLYLIGRFYFGRLILRTGISCLEDYPKFLMFEESISLQRSSMKRQKRQLQVDIRNSPNRTKRRMSVNTLRKNVKVLLKQPQLEKDEEIFKKISQKFDEKVKHRRTVVKKTMSDVTNKVTPLISLKNRLTYRSLKSFGSSSSMVEDTDDGKDDLSSESNIKKGVKESSRVRHTLQMMSRQASNMRQRSMKNLLRKEESFSKKKDEPEKVKTPTRRKNIIINIRRDDSNIVNSEEDVDSFTSIEQFKLFKLRERDEISDKKAEKSNEGLMMSYLRHQNDMQTKSSDMKLSEDLSDIYLFRNPAVYFKAVECAIMLNSIYLSLWACNFITVVGTTFDNSWIYQIIMIVPLLFVLPLLGEIVKVSSLLEAISDLNIDTIGSVLEEMEEKQNLITELRTKILSRIVGEMNDKKDTVRRLFQEIDTDHNGKISQSELRNLLRLLSLHYSDAKFSRLYNAMDQDLNGSINQVELTILVFPDLNEDEEMSRRRKRLQQRSQEIDKRRASSFSKPTLFSTLSKYAQISPTSHTPQNGSFHSQRDENNIPKNDLSTGGVHHEEHNNFINNSKVIMRCGDDDESDSDVDFEGGDDIPSPKKPQQISSDELKSERSHPGERPRGRSYDSTTDFAEVKDDESSGQRRRRASTINEGSLTLFDNEECSDSGKVRGRSSSTIEGVIPEEENEVGHECGGDRLARYRARSSSKIDDSKLEEL